MSAATKSTDLMSINLEHAQNLKKCTDIDVGIGTKLVLRELQCSVEEKEAFFRQCQLLLKSFVLKIRERSPMQFPIFRCLACLSPKFCASMPVAEAERKMTVLLLNFSAKKLITTAEADRVNAQYGSFLAEFKDYIASYDGIRLDEFYFIAIGSHADFVDLWNFVKLCLILSHGNAFTESGFSVNKDLVSVNMQEKSIVARRLLYDFIRCNGGLSNALKCIDDPMLASVRYARTRYDRYLDATKDQEQSRKRKLEKDRIDAENAALAAEKQRVLDEAASKVKEINTKLSRKK